MNAHFNFPYNWENCVNPANCPEYIHLQEKAETLNSYPQKWIESLFSCTFTEIMMTFHDSNQEPHHDSKPAIIKKDGTKIWYQHGQFHREDGPAIEWPDGSEAWYTRGIHHREDGPAATHVDGSKEWWINGSPHRDNAPAIICADGTTEWWIHGVKQTSPEIETTAA